MATDGLRSGYLRPSIAGKLPSMVISLLPQGMLVNLSTGSAEITTRTSSAAIQRFGDEMPFLEIRAL